MLPIPPTPAGAVLSKVKLGAIVFILVGAMIIGIYIYGRKEGKKDAHSIDTKLPNSGSGIPKGWDPSPVISQVHDAFGSYLFNTDNIQQTLRVLYNLTDDQLTAAYNAYNHTYQKSASSDSMYGVIKIKVMLPSVWNPFDYFDPGWRDKVLDKMLRLHLHKPNE